VTLLAYPYSYPPCKSRLCMRYIAGFGLPVISLNSRRSIVAPQYATRCEGVIMAKFRMQLSPSNRTRNVPCHHTDVITTHHTACWHCGSAPSNSCRGLLFSEELPETTTRLSRRASAVLRVLTRLTHVRNGPTPDTKQVRLALLRLPVYALR
jgi:hypothetical protein